MILRSKYKKNLGKAIRNGIRFLRIPQFASSLCARNTHSACSNQRNVSYELKANKETGEIYIDEATTLSGIPALAWEYKLGNRSTLE